MKDHIDRFTSTKLDNLYYQCRSWEHELFKHDYREWDAIPGFRDNAWLVLEKYKPDGQPKPDYITLLKNTAIFTAPSRKFRALQPHTENSRCIMEELHMTL